MKTITEYQPMIFSALEAHAVKRKLERRRRSTHFGIILGYAVLGFLLSLDTGCAPWSWQFWLMFAPLFIAGELAFRASVEP